jgi:acyl carrier protein
MERTSLAVANIDWARFAPAFASLRPRPLFEQIEAAQAALVSAGAADSNGSRRADLFRATLLALPKTARHPRLIDLVASETAAVLGAPAGSLDVRKGFLDLGLDSLMAVELKRRLHAQLALTLPATLVFDHPTIEDVATWIGRQLGVPGVAAPQSTSRHRAKTDTDYIAESLAMSDSEIERELKAIIDERV